MHFYMHYPQAASLQLQQPDNTLHLTTSLITGVTGISEGC